MGMDATEALRAGLLDDVAEYLCRNLEPGDRPCPWCAKAETGWHARRGMPPAPSLVAERVDCAECGVPHRAGQNTLCPATLRGEPPTPHVPSEYEEQVEVAKALRAAGIMFCASLGGVKLTKAQAGKAKASGYEKGEPDLSIKDPTPLSQDSNHGRPCFGMAIEMKRSDVKQDPDDPWKGATKEQREKLEALEARAWHCVVAYGARDAIQKLRDAGYDIGGAT